MRKFFVFLKDNLAIWLIIFLGYCLFLAIEKQINGFGIFSIISGIIFFATYKDIFSNVTNGDKRSKIIKESLSKGFLFLNHTHDLILGLISIFSTISPLLFKYKNELTPPQKENIANDASTLVKAMKVSESENTSPTNSPKR